MTTIKTLYFTLHVFLHDISGVVLDMCNVRIFVMVTLKTRMVMWQMVIENGLLWGTLCKVPIISCVNKACREHFLGFYSSVNKACREHFLGFYSCVNKACREHFLGFHSCVNNACREHFLGFYSCVNNACREHFLGFYSCVNKACREHFLGFYSCVNKACREHFLGFYSCVWCIYTWVGQHFDFSDIVG